LFTILTTTENAIPAIAGVGSGVSIVVGFRVCVGVDVYVGVGVRFGLGVGVDVCVGVDVIVGVGVGVDAVTDTSSTKPSLRNPFVLKYDPYPPNIIGSFPLVFHRADPYRAPGATYGLDSY